MAKRVDRAEVTELPRNTEAEQVVLGALLLEPEATGPVVFGLLKAEHFYEARHRTIFSAMNDMYEKGRPCDVVGLANRLEDRGDMEKSGGRMYLNELLDRTTTTASLEYYAEIVRRKAIRRFVISAADRVSWKAHQEGVEELDELQSECEDLPLLFAGESSNNIRELKDISHEAYDEMAAVIERGYKGFSSGLSNIDLFTRGFQPGVYVLAARPGMGKTTLMLDMAYRQAKINHPDQKRFIRPGIVSIEMDDKSLFKRLVCREMNKDWEIVPSEEDKLAHMRNIASACSTVEQHGVFIDDHHHNNIQTVVSSIYKMIIHNKVDIIYIDYVQLLGSATGGKNSNREQEVAFVMRRLVQIRKRFEIPIVVLAQLNRECESTKTKRPMLSHLRESGAIEQDADVVMFLYDPHEYFELPEDVPQELIFSKNRHGIKGTCYLNWKKQAYKFLDSDWLPSDKNEWIDKAKTKH